MGSTIDCSETTEGDHRTITFGGVSITVKDIARDLEVDDFTEVEEGISPSSSKSNSGSMGLVFLGMLSGLGLFRRFKFKRK